MVSQVDLNPLVRGDTWTNKFAFTDANGAVIDISNFVYWMTLKSNPEKDDAEAEAQTSVTATGTDAQNGIVYVTFSAAETATLQPGKYYYDLQQVNNGEVTTLLLGKVKVLRDITKTIS